MDQTAASEYAPQGYVPAAAHVLVCEALDAARAELAALRVAMRQKNGQPGMAYAVVAALRAEYDLVPKGSAALWRDLARRADGGDPGAAMQLVGAVLAALDAVPGGNTSAVRGD